MLRAPCPQQNYITLCHSINGSFTLTPVCRASPSFLISAYPQRTFWQNAVSVQPMLLLLCVCVCVYVWICTAQNWRYLVFLMPASGSYTQHAQWCEIVEGGWGRQEEVGGRERWIEGEAEEVESERQCVCVCGGERALFAQWTLQGQTRVQEGKLV